MTYKVIKTIWCGWCGVRLGEMISDNIRSINAAFQDTLRADKAYIKVGGKDKKGCICRSGVKEIVAAYKKQLLKKVDLERALYEALDEVINEPHYYTIGLYARLEKLTNGENVDSAEDEAIGQAVKNVKKLLKAI